MVSSTAQHVKEFQKKVYSMISLVCKPLLKTMIFQLGSWVIIFPRIQNSIKYNLLEIDETAGRRVSILSENSNLPQKLPKHTAVSSIAFIQFEISSSSRAWHIHLSSMQFKLYLKISKLESQRLCIHISFTDWTRWNFIVLYLTFHWLE